MTVCFFFDRINYMNSKKGHGRFNTFYGRFMTIRPFGKKFVEYYKQEIMYNEFFTLKAKEKKE